MTFQRWQKVSGGCRIKLQSPGCSARINPVTTHFLPILLTTTVASICDKVCIDQGNTSQCFNFKQLYITFGYRLKCVRSRKLKTHKQVLEGATRKRALQLLGENLFKWSYERKRIQLRTPRINRKTWPIHEKKIISFLMEIQNLIHPSLWFLSGQVRLLWSRRLIDCRGAEKTQSILSYW